MPRHPCFADRRDAGRHLAQRLLPLAAERPVVLALPRGGVPVGFEIARALQAPLDVLLVRKLGAPGQPELGLGAIVDGSPPQRVLNQRVMDMVRPGAAWLADEERRQIALIEQRKRLWQAGPAVRALEGRTVLLVDDGIATGGTVRAALLGLARSAAVRTVLAVPVAPRDALDHLPVERRDFVCLMQPADFSAVGCHYADFDQTSDDEVTALLQASRRA